MVMSRTGRKGMTSTAPIRGWLPRCWSMSISSADFAAQASADRRTASGEPTRLASSRLWSGSACQVSIRTPGTRQDARMESITSRRRPSLKLGTISTSGAPPTSFPLMPTSGGRRAIRLTVAGVPGPMPGSSGTGALPGGEADQQRPLRRPLDGELRDLSDALHVVLVIEHGRLEGRPFLREERVGEGSIGHLDRRGQGDHFVLVLRVTLVVLLPIGVTRRGIRLHKDSRLGSVLSRHPAPFGALDVALLVELCCGLAEVPHVPLPVLRVVIAGLLLEDAGEVELVVDDDARDAVDQLRFVAHDVHVARRFPVLRPPV